MPSTERPPRNPSIGTVLRLAGPLIEVVCLALLFASRGRGWSVAGVPADRLLYAGFAVGFLMVAAGLILGRALR